MPSKGLTYPSTPPALGSRWCAAARSLLQRLEPMLSEAAGFVPWQVSHGLCIPA